MQREVYILVVVLAATLDSNFNWLFFIILYKLAHLIPLSPLSAGSKFVRLSRLKNETLQIIGFEGFFNLNNIASIQSKSITTFIFNMLQEVRIHLGSENII